MIVAHTRGLDGSNQILLRRRLGYLDNDICQGQSLEVDLLARHVRGVNESLETHTAKAQIDTVAGYSQTDTTAGNAQTGPHEPKPSQQ